MLSLHRSKALLLVFALTCGVVPMLQADEPAGPLVEQYLVSGQLAQGEQTLSKQIAEHANDREARFGLGVLQFVQAVEHLSQSLYRYGLKDHSKNFLLPILRIPVPPNPDPARLSYEQSRKILQTLVDDLARAEATLAGVGQGDVMLRLHFGRIKLDLNGDGRVDDDETLWRIYSRLNRAAVVQQADAEQFVIAFDKADVPWLRGYCHLLMCLGEMALAHDGRELFERTGHVFFAEVETPHKYLVHGRRVFDINTVDIADLIAVIHLINLPVTEPKRMQVALDHLEKVIALSRENWRDLLAETDNDREWIPNPKQSCVIPGVQITQQMASGWQEFLNEAELILQGKKLIPFWRAVDPRGVNLRRVFTEPRTFDLVLWVQGTAAAPYLEEGPLSTPDVWQRFNRLFNGQFVGFAIWIN